MDYPKYQVSKMEGDYQVVFRTDDKDEFDGFVKEIKTIHMNGEVKRVESVKAFDKDMGAPSNTEVCRDCGAKRVLNPKTGKMFCEKKCWLNKQKTY